MGTHNSVTALVDDPHNTSDGLLIVGIGGSTRRDSSSERALRVALGGAAQEGARSVIFNGAELASLPIYPAESTERTPLAERLVETLSVADGVVVASPGYHGGPSGLIKNALDYAEDLRNDSRPYLDGRAVGCIACAFGWQATVTTLTALRAVVHALRGWPTPLGVAINSAETEDGAWERAALQLDIMGRQVADFAAAHRRPRPTGR